MRQRRKIVVADCLPTSARLIIYVSFKEGDENSGARTSTLAELMHVGGFCASDNRKMPRSGALPCTHCF